MPRTTVDLDAGVLRSLKRRSAKEGKPMSVIASELLGRALAEGDDASTTRPFSWTNQSMGARIDIDDKEALWAALDNR